MRAHPCPCSFVHRRTAFKCPRTVGTPRVPHRCHEHCLPRDCCSQAAYGCCTLSTRAWTSHPCCRIPCPAVAHVDPRSLHSSPCSPASIDRNQIFNQIVAVSNTDFASPNGTIPSVPLQKLVPKNDGTRVSSTSFITASDDQQYSDNVEASEKNSQSSSSNRHAGEDAESVEHFVAPTQSKESIASSRNTSRTNLGRRTMRSTLDLGQFLTDEDLSHFPT